MTIGDSWSNQYTYEKSDDLIEVKSNYEVIDKELVTTPLGEFEAYKVEYSQFTQDACTSFDCSSDVSDSYRKTGTIWHVPELGEIKRVEQYVIVKSHETRTINMTSIISETNIL